MLTASTSTSSEGSLRRGETYSAAVTPGSSFDRMPPS
jgi:hypothetical protein